MGDNAIGCSVSLVSAGEEKFQKVIFNEIGKGKFSTVHLDSRLLSGCQARVNLATKIVSCQEVESRTERNNKWFKDAAIEAGLELDDDLYDAGLAGGDRKDQQRYQEAKRAQILLRDLLSQPLVTRRFGKFLSCNNAVLIPPTGDDPSSINRERRKKKQKKRR
jgi:ATP-dependent RNA helicase DDX24/MAK5